MYITLVVLLFIKTILDPKYGRMDVRLAKILADHTSIFMVDHPKMLFRNTPSWLTMIATLRFPERGEKIDLSEARSDLLWELFWGKK